MKTAKKHYYRFTNAKLRSHQKIREQKINLIPILDNLEPKSTRKRTD